MNSHIDLVLSSSIPDYKNLPEKKQVELCGAILMYVFRVIDSSELSKIIRSLDKTYNPKHVRMELLSNGSILRDIKLFTYASTIYTGVPRHLYKVKSGDEYRVLEALDGCPRLKRALKKFKTQGYKPLMPEKMDSLVNGVLKELDVYCAKFVRKKMRFIVTSQGTTYEDIEQDLLSWATYALYKAYPQYDSFEHAVNIAKRVAHNRGINFIMESTSQSRARTIKNKDGTFSSLTVPFHTLLTPNGLDGHLTQYNHLVVDITGVSATNKTVGRLLEDVELKMSVKALYKKLPPRYQRLLLLWSGHHDAEFSESLGQDNDEWIDTVSRREYCLRAVDFLEIDRKEAKMFHRRLQEKFLEYAPPKTQKG